uniref:Minor capsid protein P9 transmembrane helices domain-containing protein n=1 Tax=viral metagenome TaxID=1070528 RepID=A0A6C0E965_9ZZZZ
MTTDIFWLNNPTVLLTDYTSFFPTTVMSRVQQLNALTRLILYFAILMSVTGKMSDNWVKGIIIALIVIIMLYYLSIYDKDGKVKEFNRHKNVENMSNLDTMPIEVESGYYDTEGNLRIGKFYSHEQNRNKELEYTLSEYEEFRKNKCRKPTADNPFMNPTLADFNTENDPIACNGDDEDIKEQRDIAFNQNLFRDLNDLFDVKNAERQFATVPINSVPNDQEAFAKWCYGTGLTCKEDSFACQPRNTYRSGTS